MQDGASRVLPAARRRAREAAIDPPPNVNVPDGSVATPRRGAAETGRISQGLAGPWGSALPGAEGSRRR